MRDNFSLPTIRILAARAAHRCSNPSCKQLTSGPRLDSDMSINIGVGAHITAASFGGPRFDPSLTIEKRSSVNNGIWLCQNCAKLVDNDEQRFSVSLLQSWKSRAEEDAAAELHAENEIDGPRFAILERILKSHTNYVWDVTISPNGRRVFSASNDKTVKMWDLATGNLLATFLGHTSFICSVSISPDGVHLAAGAFDGSIKVWDTDSADVIANLHHGDSDAKVAWSPTGDELASGGADGVLRVWDVHEKLCANEINCHEAPILKVAYLSDGTRAVSVSADKTAKIFRLDDGSCLRTFVGHTGEINSVAVSCDQRTMLSASEDLTLKSWKIVSGDCSKTLYGHSDIVWRVAIAPDCRLAASGSADNTVMLWDLDTGICLDKLKHPECVAAIAFSPDGERLVVGCDDAVLYVYTVEALPRESSAAS